MNKMLVGILLSWGSEVGGESARAAAGWVIGRAQATPRRGPVTAPTRTVALRLLCRTVAIEPGAPAAPDESELARFGYRQELRRRLGTFSSFAIGFSVISVLTGVTSTFGE